MININQAFGPLDWDLFGNALAPGAKIDLENNVITVLASRFPRLSEYAYSLPVKRPVQFNPEDTSSDPFSDDSLKKRYLNAISEIETCINEPALTIAKIVRFAVKIDECKSFPMPRTQLTVLPSPYTKAKTPKTVFAIAMSVELASQFDQDQKGVFIHLLKLAEKEVQS